MPIVSNDSVPKLVLPGLVHQTVVTSQYGINSMQLWLQKMGPQVATPMHHHECEEVIVVLKGSGLVIADGVQESFGPNSTLMVPAGVVHQIINTGAEDLDLVTVLGVGTGQGRVEGREKTSTAIITESIPAPAAVVWSAISNFGAVPVRGLVTSCRVEGSGVGMKRIVGLLGGIELVEQLEHIDEATRTYSYRMTQIPMPMLSYVATVKVIPDGPHSSTVEWSSVFIPVEEYEHLLKSVFQGIYRDGLAVLRAAFTPAPAA